MPINWLNADLLPHEFTHSWNGKYRRPVGLYQPDFATPQQGALLWVYEGMTQYLGDMLATRSGIRDPGAISRYVGASPLRFSITAWPRLAVD